MARRTYTVSSRSAPHIFSSAYIARASGLNRCTTMSPASISTQSDTAGAFHLHALQPRLVQLLAQMLRHGGDLPVGQAGGDHHAVAERRLPRQVQRDDLLGLVVLQAADDHRLQAVQLRRLRRMRARRRRACAARRRRSSCAAVPGVLSAAGSVGLAVFLRGAARAVRAMGVAWLWYGSFAGSANIGGGHGGLARRQEHPGRRAGQREHGGLRGRAPRNAEPPRRMPRQRATVIGGTRQNRHRHVTHDIAASAASAATAPECRRPSARRSGFAGTAAAARAACRG